MKSPIFLPLFTAGLVVGCSIPSVFAQGSLTPPAGPPAPEMKTLDQVEPRTPLVSGAAGVSINANGTITISQSGSYYLTGNRTITTPSVYGISVSASNVTLDLNGFSLICTAVNGIDAIGISGSQITIRNGKIIGGSSYDSGTATWTLSGWDSGIDANSSGLLVQDVIVSGCRNRGLVNGATSNGIIERCIVKENRQTGIMANQVIDCTVNTCGGTAITHATLGSVVKGCRVLNALSSGIDGNNESVTSDCAVSAAGTAIAGGTVTNCSAKSTTGAGISASIVTNCRAVSTSGTGISGTTVSNSIGDSTSGVGISGNNATNCFGRSISGTHGINVSGTASFCQGVRSGGTAIQAAIAVGCTSLGGSVSSPQKHLGTPTP